MFSYGTTPFGQTFLKTEYKKDTSVSLLIWERKRQWVLLLVYNALIRRWRLRILRWLLQVELMKTLWSLSSVSFGLDCQDICLYGIYFEACPHQRALPAGFAWELRALSAANRIIGRTDESRPYPRSERMKLWMPRLWKQLNSGAFARQQ